MKRLLGFGMLVLGAFSTSYAQYGSGSSGQYGQYGQYGQQQQQQMQQQMPQQSTVPSDCSHLSQQEQQFASQLSEMHRTMFCRHFSVSQRIEAMTLANAQATGLTGGPVEITPDEAVEVVMKNARQNGSNGMQNGNDTQQQPQQNPYGNSYSYPSGGNNNSGQSSNPYSNY